MKKLFALILTFTLLLLCTSCKILEKVSTTKNSEDKNTKSTEITLTKENFEEYFNVNIYNTDYQEKVSAGFIGKEYGYSCIVNIEISKTSDFEIMNDVIITYFINTAYDNVPGSYRKENSHRCIDIKIPSSGNINKKVQCTQSPTMVKLHDEPTVYFEDIVGTIIVK